MTTEGPDQAGRDGELYRGTKAAVYVRNSTARPPYDKERQLDAMSRFAVSQDIAILEDHVYEDEAPGNSKARRPDYKKLMAVIGTGKAPFRTVLVYDKARWTRNAENLRADERTLKRFGIRLVSVTDVAAGHEPV